MDINLYMIEDDLKEETVRRHLVSDPWKTSLHYPIFCSGELQKERVIPNALYVIRAENLPAERFRQDSFAFICLGIPNESWFSGKCDFICLDDGVHPDELMNEINEIFYLYTDWGDRLQQVIDLDIDTREMAVQSFDIVRNPLYLQRNSFIVEFHYHPEVPNPTPLYRDYQKTYGLKANDQLSTEDINDLIADPEYNAAVNAREPTIYHGGPFGFRSLYYNLYIHDVCVARLLFDEVISKFRPKDFALIKILGDYIAKKMKLSTPYEYDRPYDFDDTMTKLLRHKFMPEGKIRRLLSTLGWKMDDTYLCMVMQIRSPADTHYALDPIALSISRNFFCKCYVVLDDSIVFVCNLTAMKISEESLLSSMLPVLRDNLLEAGVSSAFHDFKNTYYFYQQAIMAKKIGSGRHPTMWYFRFSDYYMDFLLSQCLHGTIPEVFIPGGLADLMEHDSEKNTNYVELLRVYLDCDRNIAETVRRTYLHRNTFLYRIDKIKKILGMDLDEPNNRLILQMAFRILDVRGGGY